VGKDFLSSRVVFRSSLSSVAGKSLDLGSVLPVSDLDFEFSWGFPLRRLFVSVFWLSCSGATFFGSSVMEFLFFAFSSTIISLFSDFKGQLGARVLGKFLQVDSALCFFDFLFVRGCFSPFFFLGHLSGFHNGFWMFFCFSYGTIHFPL